MALEDIQQGSPPQGRELSQALKELQGLTIGTATAGADYTAAASGTRILAASLLMLVMERLTGLTRRMRG